jgi:DNA-binding transcriptional MerR regulator
MLSMQEDCLAFLIDRREAPADHLRTIGEVSRECGVTLRALRFYEGKGLLRPSREGATRLYDDVALRRLEIIVRAKRVGFTLIEIRELLDLIFSPAPVAERLGGTLDRLRRQVDLLEIQRLEVERALDTAHGEIAALEHGLGG